MSVRRWASQDLVLAAFCVAAITLGLWPKEPTRQMIHSRDLAGNTSYYSLRTDDSRLARLTRELARRQNPRPTVEIAVAKWRIGLAGHYARHLDTATGRGAIMAKSDSNDSNSSSSGVPVVQVGFSPDTQVSLASNPNAAAVLTQSQEIEFWHGISQKSEAALESAQRQAAEERAKNGPPAIVLGKVFQPSKSSNAWITAILLGLLASCVFADWAMRFPAIVINRDVAAEPSSQSESAISLQDYSRQDIAPQDTVRLQIPVEWIRIHQPFSVQSRRWSLVGLVLAAFVTNLV